MSKDRARAAGDTDGVPLPPGHYAQLTAPRGRVRGRERVLVAGGLAMLVAIAVAVIISFTSVQRRSRDGCIDVSAATAIGGSELYRCGATARALCAQSRSRSSVAFTRALDTSCRRAGLPGPHA
jgi:hypothetical protein